MNHSSSPAPDSTAKSGDGTTARTWVSLRRLSKTFGPAQVLQEVDLDVRAAEIHGLVGQNGSGKSTLIKVLSGVHSADPGSAIEVNGARLSNPVRPAELRRHGLAFVHQDLGLVDQCTVVKNIRLGQFHVRAVSRRVDWSQERRAAEQTLDRLHTHLDTSRLVGSLTAGERVVVAIGRALQSIVPGGGCIVVDESTRALPREILPGFYEIVRRLAASGTPTASPSRATARGYGSSRRPTCPPAPAPRPPTPPGPGTRTGNSRSCTRSCGACKNR